MRIAAAIAALLAGLVLAVLFGASLEGALVALAGGAASLALLRRAPDRQPSALPETSAGEELALPKTSDVVEGLEEPILVVRDRRVVMANSAATSLLGRHIVGSDARLAIRHPAGAERLAEKEPGNGDRIIRTDIAGLGERERRWEMTVVRLGDGSRLVRLSDRSEVYASEKMRADFVANASHELRTPLATILGFLETLEDGDAAENPATRARFLSIMAGEARRMQRLVDDLISLSRIEAERFTLPNEAVDLHALAQEVRRNCGPLAEEKGCDIVIEGDPASVTGDRLQLVQLIQNLVDNALKYGRPGEPVLISFSKTGPETVCMKVADRGEGIPPEHLPRLTERFYRVDPGRSRSEGGTGLGLAIVKHIVSRHRGELEITSEVGNGTCIRICFPATSEADVTKA